MRMILWVFSLCLGFSCVTMKKEGSFARGIEGESVEVVCEYPTANYKSTPKYFCRATCLYKTDVLVKSVATNVSVSNGRYSLNDNTSGLYFTISIRGLTAQDSGSYYCGFDHLGLDRYTPVLLHVVHASASNSSVSTPEPQAHQDSTTNNSNKPLHSTGTVVISVVCGVSLAVLVSCVLLSLVILYRKRTAAGKSHGLESAAAATGIQTPAAPPQAEEDAVHVCDEMVELTLYSAVQFHSEPQGEPSDPYSLVQPTTPSHNTDHLRGRPAQQTSHTDVYSIIEGSQQPPNADTTDVYSLLTPH